MVKFQAYEFNVSNIKSEWYLINSFSFREKIDCLKNCGMNLNCALFTRIDQQCNFYSENALNYLVKATQKNLYMKIKPK